LLEEALNLVTEQDIYDYLHARGENRRHLLEFAQELDPNDPLTMRLIDIDKIGARLKAKDFEDKLTKKELDMIKGDMH